ncbi:MAG: hypothetical protein P1Q69_16795 [Candidatus Thorarchaeota archaeon]|nr:hypothetical protein [Candidatus Thorarchaeota archaeon]
MHAIINTRVSNPTAAVIDKIGIERICATTVLKGDIPKVGAVIDKPNTIPRNVLMINADITAPAN